MKTGLASIPLIDTQEGREKMRGWVVLTPSGAKVELVSVNPSDVGGEWSVTVFGDFGHGHRSYKAFPATELRTF